jgi:hypothetical protein
MPTYTFPSTELPSPPSFEIDVPDGWRTDQAPETIAVFFDPASPPGFKVNLVVSVDRVEEQVTLEDAARETLRQSEEGMPAYQLEQERVVDVDGMPASLRFQSFEPAAAPGRLMQMQVLFFGPRDDGVTKDLVQLNATCRYEDDERYAQTFVDMAKSFRFRR